MNKNMSEICVWSVANAVFQGLLILAAQADAYILEPLLLGLGWFWSTLVVLVLCRASPSGRNWFVRLGFLTVLLVTIILYTFTKSHICPRYRPDLRLQS